MKTIYMIMAAWMCFTLASCGSEDALTPSEDLGIDQLFNPPADAPAEIKQMFTDYGVWVRMDFTVPSDVSNARLYQEQNYWRFGLEKVEDAYRPSAVAYAQAFLSNVSKEYAQAFFPQELFFVKAYGGTGVFSQNTVRIGRTRFVMTWPSRQTGTLLVDPLDYTDHYYHDTILAPLLWTNFGGMIASRFTRPLAGFEEAGKAYDNREAIDAILNQYYDDGDLEKRYAAEEELARTGGFIQASGSPSFETDYPQWIRLLATDSYENIKTQYLDNSPARKAKYDIIVKHFNDYGWDIQAAGNKWRQKYNEYKASFVP